jgi:hypothetical protein
MELTVTNCQGGAHSQFLRLPDFRVRKKNAISNRYESMQLNPTRELNERRTFHRLRTGLAIRSGRGISEGNPGESSLLTATLRLCSIFRESIHIDSC